MLGAAVAGWHGVGRESQVETGLAPPRPRGVAVSPTIFAIVRYTVPDQLPYASIVSVRLGFVFIVLYHLR